MNGTALLYTAVAASANIIGAAAVVSRSRWSVRALENMVALSAGFMVSVALLDLVDEGLYLLALHCNNCDCLTTGVLEDADLREPLPEEVIVVHVAGS